MVAIADELLAVRYAGQLRGSWTDFLEIVGDEGLGLGKLGQLDGRGTGVAGHIQLLLND